MMGALRVVFIFAILLSCSFAKSTEKSEYQGGPLPFLRLKKAGFDLTKLSVRAGSSPGPCTVCCRQQRQFDRFCDIVTTEQAEFDAACAALATAQTALDAARAAVQAKSAEILQLQQDMQTVRVQIATIRGDIFDGGETPEERRALRAQIRELRAQLMTMRAAIQLWRSGRDPLLLTLEEVTGDFQDRQDDKSDERSMLNRAIRRRDRAQTRLNTCLAAVSG